VSDIEFVGPFESHVLVLNGHSVPFADATPIDGGVHLCLDNRFGVDLTHDEAERVIPFLADGIAVALGYTCFPCDEAPEPRKRTPWPRLTSLADNPPVVDQ
jgi:hypothetical protein